MGAIVGGCYATGMSTDAVRDALLGLKALDIVDIDALPFTRLSLLRSKKLQKLFLKYIGDATFEGLKIPFSCTAVDLYSGKLYVFKEGSLVKAVQASSCIPGIFRPVEHEGMLLVDGGVLCRVPAAQVKQLGADVVVAVDVLGKLRHPDKIGNIISLITRVYDIVEDKNAKSSRRSARKVTDLWLEPDMGDISQYQIKYQPAVYEAGYKTGKENAAKIRALLEGGKE